MKEKKIRFEKPNKKKRNDERRWHFAWWANETDVLFPGFRTIRKGTIDRAVVDVTG